MAEILRNKYDTAAPVLTDEVPQKMQTVYLYPLENTKNGKAFIKDLTTSIVYYGYIGQTEAVLSINTDSEMIDANSYNDFGKEIKNIATINAEANFWVDNPNDYPLIATVNNPINPDKWASGEQEVYYLTDIVIAKQPSKDPKSINPEGLITFTLNNMRRLINTFDRAQVFFTPDPDFTDTIQWLDLKTQNQTLIHSISGKGVTNPTTAIGNTSFGDVEFYSGTPLYPMRVVPTYVEDKLVLAFPWLDYDHVMPLFAAKLFPDTGATASAYITDASDRQLLEDILLFSYMFATEFKDIPIIADQSSKLHGELDPNYKIGHTGIQGSKVWREKPAIAVDKLITAHIQKHPAFPISRSRYQSVYQMINALSQYIFSSYATAGGNNAQHQALLPWYLEILGDDGLKPTIDTSAKTILPNSNTKFRAKSVYFNDKFGKKIAEHGVTKFDPVPNLNLSSMKNIQTDRKITLPIIPDTIRDMDISFFPMDQDMSQFGYITYLPLSVSNWEKYMLNTSSVINNNQPAEEKQVHVSSSISGHLQTVDEAIADLLKQYPGATVIVPPTASEVEGTTQKSKVKAGDNRNQSRSSGSISDISLYWRNPRWSDALGTEVLRTDGRRSEDEIKATIAARFNYDVQSIVLHTTEGDDHGHYYEDYFTLKYTEFSDATIRLLAGTGTSSFSAQGREFLLDKQEFREIMLEYGFAPSATFTLRITEDPKWEIDNLSELIIKSLFDDDWTIRDSYGYEIKVNSISDDNEEISTKRILFT